MFTLEMTQVQLRLPQKMIDEIDKWVEEGRYKNRSDAIKTILSIHEEREKTREFLNMLNMRRKEAEENPDILVPLEE
jgi:Arc/MetJ-type ribon-helix-helix transcriptional regulator